MANIKNLEIFAPIYGDKLGDRPTELVNDLNVLEKEGLNFETYSMRTGDILRFPKFEDMVVRAQPVRKGLAAKVYLVACERERNGKAMPYWFNLNTLTKRDIDNVPVHPEYYEAGNILARVKLLAEKGAITSTETVTIDVPVFTEDNKLAKEEEVDAHGNVVLKTKVTQQEVAKIEDYVG